MDRELARAINQLGAGTLDPFTELVSDVPLLVAIWLGLLVLAWWLDRPRARRVTLGVGLALVVHALVSELLLKHGLLLVFSQRVRPWMADPSGISPVGYRFEDSSFPSSHCASTAAVLTVLLWHYPRAWWLGAGFVLVMAFSRVHNGMHYPTDVLAGTLLGLGYGAVAVTWIERRLGPHAAPVASPSSVAGG